MSLFRNVNISFWTDTKIVDEYTPEDKYFMLYAMTNQYTNIIGCYEISMKQMSNDLGYTKDVVERIINRFKEIHKTIDYNNDTKELIIKNCHKYNWSVSPKLDKPLYSNIEKIKCDEFHDYLANIYNQRTTIEENIPYRYGIEKNEYPMDTTITITNTIPITNSISNTINKSITNKELEEEFEIIWSEYPNKKGKANALKSYIKARKKGITKEDIMIGLNNYLTYIKVEKINQQYIKHGSTWFNQECWNDDYTIKREVTTGDLANAGLVDFSKFR